MKKLIYTLTNLFFGFLTYAQCPIEPSCSNSFLSTNGISNQNFTQSVCIYGQGSIHTSNNFNVWSNTGSYLKFEASTGNMQVLAPINMTLDRKMWLMSELPHKVKLHYLSMSGSDTVVVADGSKVEIDDLISNNSLNQPWLSPPLNYNVIILGINSTLKVDGQWYEIGDTICTGGNESNNVYIIGCNSVPLPITIIEFRIQDKTLLWKVETKELIKIQYSDDSKNWKNIYFTYENQGKLPLLEAGFYRLEVEGEYSEIERYNMRSLIPEKTIYYIPFKCQFSTEQPKDSIYGIKR